MNTDRKQQQEIQRQLKALHDSYVGQLPERIAEIEQDWKSLHTCAAPATALRELYRRLHSLAGSAGSFGLPEVGQEARSVEQHLKMKLDDAHDWTDSEQENVAAGIARLRRLITTLHTTSATADAVSVQTDAGRPHNLVYLMEEDSSRSARLQGKLVHFGYRVVTYYDRSELASAVRRERPMALIMDFHTREVQTACTNWLIDLQRQLDDELPVIFIAADTRFEVRLQAVRAGGYAYLEQPVDIAALVDRLDSVNADLQPEPYRVLVVDDDRQLARHFALVLAQAGIEVRSVHDPAELLDRLAEFQPDLMLMDLYLSEYTGMELARLIRQDISRVSMPIVFLSAETDQEKQYSALMTGGDEFITKPVQDRQLVAVVKSRAQRARVLENAMSRDGLTGLLKHTKIKEALELELVRARRQGTLLSYAMLDIDFFKKVNDTYGHPMGDRVIKGLAHLLQQRLRQTDLVGRYGGEEFAVILPDTEAEGAVAVLEEVRRAFGDIEFDADGGTFSVTLSVGVVTCGRCGDANAVAEQADRALYEAKRTGRNRTVCIKL